MEGSTKDRVGCWGSKWRGQQHCPHWGCSLPFPSGSTGHPCHLWSIRFSLFYKKISTKTITNPNWLGQIKQMHCIKYQSLHFSFQSRCSIALRLDSLFLRKGLKYRERTTTWTGWTLRSSAGPCSQTPWCSPRRWDSPVETDSDDEVLTSHLERPPGSGRYVTGSYRRPMGGHVIVARTFPYWEEKLFCFVWSSLPHEDALRF